MITAASLRQNKFILLKFLSYNTKIVLILIFLAILIFASLIAISCGNFNISFSDIFSVIFAHISPFTDIESVNRLHNTIIWKIRLPRIVLAINVGIALSISGAVFQGCFRNPLVEPYILGISSGAAFGAALGILFPSFFLSVQTLAFCFAFIAVAAAYFLARTRGETPIITLILAGIIIGSVFSAFVGIIKYLAEDTALREIVFWLMGGFYYATWDDVILISPIIFVSFSIIWFHSWKLNILSMGDDEAKALGINPEKFKFMFIILATLSTAVAVSSVGIIAWVGLMMPHATRMVMGPDHRYLIPVSAIFGALYLIICDTIARNLVNAEIPIGIITSILGAPYLFYLIRSRGASAFGG